MKICWINTSALNSADRLSEMIPEEPGTVVCLAEPSYWNSLNESIIAAEIAESDIFHLATGRGHLNGVQSITFSWYFINPSEAIRSRSWKATKEFVSFRSELFHSLGGFDSAYETLSAAILDFAYRAMIRGAKIVCAASPNPMQPVGPISYDDELRFVRKFFSRWAFLFYTIVHGGWWRTRPSITTGSVGSLTVETRLSGHKIRSVSAFSAIIPTLNRYDYLDKAIQSLLDSSFPPGEVLVIDQTPLSRRIPGYYDRFVAHGRVKVTFLESPGQASSRNEGIRQARNEWIYFFDDDSLCWKDCLKEHRYLLEHSLADVSTGLSLAPWKDISYIAPEWTYFRLADVLDTGNCCVRKETLEKVGGIGMAYERGPGADDDLGKRLYLSGAEIVWNPRAIRTHYKATQGGLREHGAWWRNQSRLFDAFPPPTQLFMMRKYYPKNLWFTQVVLLYLLSRKRQSLLSFLFSVVVSPIRYIKALKKVKDLESKFK